MRTVGNVLWLILAGWWLALGYVLAGIVAFILIITIPFGIAAFRLAGFVIWPFGRTTVFRRNAGVWSVIGNVIWLVVVGWELALAHLVAGLFINLVPIFGTLLSIVLLGETFHLYHAVALLMVLGGIWLAEHSGRKRAG
jgi:uncharacterized membrane protein YccF (DUF307 family)